MRGAPNVSSNEEHEENIFDVCFAAANAAIVAVHKPFEADEWYKIDAQARDRLVDEVLESTVFKSMFEWILARATDCPIDISVDGPPSFKGVVNVIDDDECEEETQMTQEAGDEPKELASHAVSSNVVWSE